MTTVSIRLILKTVSRIQGEQEHRATKEAEADAFLRNRRDAYVRTFTSEDGKRVLADLRWFCRLDNTPWDADPRIHALMTGRFEVGRRILDHVDLTFDQLVEKYTKTPEGPE